MSKIPFGKTHTGFISPEGEFIESEQHIDYLYDRYGKEAMQYLGNDRNLYLYDLAFRDGFIRVYYDEKPYQHKDSIELGIEGWNNEQVHDIVQKYAKHINMREDGVIAIDTKNHYYAFHLPTDIAEFRDYVVNNGGLSKRHEYERKRYVSESTNNRMNIYNMKRKRPIKESMGAGFSMSGGGRSMFRGSGYGGGSNLGGNGNMMYTYEIKPLNHVLEPKASSIDTTLAFIRLGSKISGVPLRTNATPVQRRVQGILKDIVETDDHAVKYYVIFDEATAQLIKVDPTTVRLMVEDPVEKYFPATDSIPSRREQKLKGKNKDNKLVSENLLESVERQNQKRVYIDVEDDMEFIYVYRLIDSETQKPATKEKFNTGKQASQFAAEQGWEVNSKPAPYSKYSGYRRFSR